MCPGVTFLCPRVKFLCPGATGTILSARLLLGSDDRAMGSRLSAVYPPESVKEEELVAGRCGAVWRIVS